jgi:EAL domain-containing protein (putative c-di-GMP-specific phosphodiesterase class I)
MPHLNQKIIRFDQDILDWQPKVLVVEDDPIMMEILQARLKQMGLSNVLPCTNGFEAIGALNENNLYGSTPIELILLDLMMPKMNGHQFLDSVIAKPLLKNTKIIIHSSEPPFSDLFIKAQKHINMVDFLDKTSITPENYILSITSALRKLAPNIEAYLQYQKIRNALVRDSKDMTNGIPLYGQPIFNLQTGKIKGYELLLRWIFEGKVTSPELIIRIANEYGILGLLSGKIFEKAAFHALQDRSKRIYTFNVNNDELDSPEFVSYLKRYYGRYPKLKKKLYIEITEQSLISNMETLEKIKEAEINIILDDFGVDHANIDILYELDLKNIISYVKLDKKIIY